jgi:hypothetical protein
MASLTVLAFVVLVTGALFGAFVRISLAIRREDRARTLRWDPPDRSAKSARLFVGYTRRR